MFKVLFGGFMAILGFWLWFGDPAKDPYGQWFGTYIHTCFIWVAQARPYSTIIAFVLSVAAFVTIKRY